MKASTLAAVPEISLKQASCDPERFAAELGMSFERSGFAIIADHDLPADLIDTAWEEARQLFALPLSQKRRYRHPESDGTRGYTDFGIEVAKGASSADLKEFWHVGRDVPADNALPNIWPEGRTEFKRTFIELYERFESIGGVLLRGVAQHLGLASDWFDGVAKGGNHTLRLLHYPPIAADAPGVRAGAHEDINLITLLLGAGEAGLELLDRHGRWLAVAPPAGALVVNVGDMLRRLTNDLLPSTTHRVINPPPERRGVSRYSMPFFMHPRSDFLIETLPGCIGPDRPNRYPQPILEHDFLKQRLLENGMLKITGKS